MLVNNVGLSYDHAEYYDAIDDKLIDDLIAINIQATNKASFYFLFFITIIIFIFRKKKPFSSSSSSPFFPISFSLSPLLFSRNKTK